MQGFSRSTDQDAAAIYASNYDALVAEWIDLMRTYNIPHEDSDLADGLRRQQDHFFGLTPDLPAQFRDLITTYQDCVDHTDSLPPSPELGLGFRPTMPVPSRSG
ncbi:hypothetical protein AAVH_20484 [Aphelenchoides avenae]|nr:hypothetical protein AAVH_20484 [Aphelenchus avenae]